MVEGGDVGGQFWTPAGSPYVVSAANGHLIVPAGKELRIEAGTVVLFSSSAGQPWVDVAGTLAINGTAGAPVLLQGEEGGTAVVWQGIGTRICDTVACSNAPAAVVTITGAIIRNAGYGLRYSASASVSVDKTTFENCTVGLSVDDYSGTGKKNVFDSIIARNNRTGVECTQGASVTVTNALIQGNTSHGVIS